MQRLGWAARTARSARCWQRSLKTKKPWPIGSPNSENRDDVAAGEFPMMFTAWHDLSIEFCLAKMIQRQKEAIQFIEQAVAALDRFPLAKALVEEALGASRGHLESLQELTEVQGSQA